MANINLHSIGNKVAFAAMEDHEYSIPKLRIIAEGIDILLFLHEGHGAEFALKLRESLSDYLEEIGVEPPRHMPEPEPVALLTTFEPCLYCNGRGNQVYSQMGGGFSSDICQACNGKGTR